MVPSGACRAILTNAPASAQRATGRPEVEGAASARLLSTAECSQPSPDIPTNRGDPSCAKMPHHAAVGSANSGATLQSKYALLRPLQTLRASQERLGDCFTVNFASRTEIRRAVIVFDPASVNAVFSADPTVVLGGRANRTLRPVIGNRSLAVMDGVEHLAWRKLLLPHFRGARLKEYEPLTQPQLQRVHSRGRLKRSLISIQRWRSPPFPHR